MGTLLGRLRRSRWVWPLVLGAAVVAFALWGFSQNDRHGRIPMTPTSGQLPALPRKKPQRISIEGAVIRGRRDARVACIAYVDFQSGLSRMWSEHWLGAVLKQYVESGKLLLAVKCIGSAPKSAWAHEAAKAAYCSAAQGKFWEMYGKLMTAELEDHAIDVAASRIGLRGSSFSECMNSAAADKVRRDELEASTLGVAATPVLIFGTLEQGHQVLITQQVTGAPHPELFARIVEAVAK